MEDTDWQFILLYGCKYDRAINYAWLPFSSKFKNITRMHNSLTLSQLRPVVKRGLLGCFSTRDVRCYVVVNAFGLYQSYSLIITGEKRLRPFIWKDACYVCYGWFPYYGYIAFNRAAYPSRTAT